MPTGDAAIGAITAPSSNALAITGPTGLVVGSITGNGGVKSGSVTKYTVAGGTTDYVQLGTAAATFVVKLTDKTFTLVGDTTLASALTIGGAAKVSGAITTPVANFALTTENLGKLAADSSVSYSDAVTVSAALTIPADIAVAVTASETALTVAATGSIVAEGGLVAKNAVALSGPVTIGTVGAFILDTGKAITLAATTAKIVGGTYEISTTATTGTLTAGEDTTAVAFANDTIQGTDDSYDPLAGATTAATLTFGAAASTLSIKEETTIAGVILDVSAQGTISVTDGKTLTLEHAGTNGAASGGIYTKAGGNSTINVVKANGLTKQGTGSSTALSADTAAGLAAATVAANNSTGSAVASGTPASGVIIGAATIDKNDTFAVSTNAITATPVDNS